MSPAIDFFLMHIQVKNSEAYFVWRSLYFSRLLSQRNRVQVLTDWSRTALFGRDIAAPEAPEPK